MQQAAYLVTRAAGSVYSMCLPDCTYIARLPNHVCTPCISVLRSLACFAFAYIVRLGKCKRVRGFVEEFTLITLRVIARSRATSRNSRIHARA